MSETIHLDKARHDLILRAAYQLAGMSEVMFDLLGKSADEEVWAAQGMAARIKTISSVIMSSVQDTVEPVESIEARFRGL